MITEQSPRSFWYIHKRWKKFPVTRQGFFGYWDYKNNGYGIILITGTIDNTECSRSYRLIKEQPGKSTARLCEMSLRFYDSIDIYILPSLFRQTHRIRLWRYGAIISVQLQDYCMRMICFWYGKEKDGEQGTTWLIPANTMKRTFTVIHCIFE